MASVTGLSSATVYRDSSKVNANYPRSLFGRLVGATMPWIDLVMMRKQLQQLKTFAERGARSTLLSGPIDR
jgi:hypothetical protein